MYKINFVCYALKLVKFITEHIAYRRVIFCELLFER